MCYSQIWQNFVCDEYLCKLGKEYLNASLCKFVIYSLQHFETFDVSHVFLPLTIAELSMLKQVHFLAHPVFHYYTVIMANWCNWLDVVVSTATAVSHSADLHWLDGACQAGCRPTCPGGTLFRLFLVSKSFCRHFLAFFLFLLLQSVVFWIVMTYICSTHMTVLIVLYCGH